MGKAQRCTQDTALLPSPNKKLTSWQEFPAINRIWPHWFSPFFMDLHAQYILMPFARACNLTDCAIHDWVIYFTVTKLMRLIHGERCLCCKALKCHSDSLLIITQTFAKHNTVDLIE